jgi:hypothetical protein
VVTPDVARSGCYQVNVGGKLREATVHLRPPFDPAGDRVKGRYPSLPDDRLRHSSASSP